ncbi:MAG: ABC transporter permease [bacterium]
MTTNQTSAKNDRAKKKGILNLLARWIDLLIDPILRPIFGFLEYIGQLALLILQTLWFLITLRINFAQAIQQMSHLGTDSLFIVTLCLGFTGMILSTILTQQALEIGFGIEYIGGVVVYSFAKDLAPVLAGLIMAGRVGAGIASEIGTMKVTDQIDALRALAVPPVRHLVVPRLLACAVMVPVITIIAGFAGVWLGWLPVHLMPAAHISYRIYFDGVFSMLTERLLKITFTKSFCFGITIALIACLEGFMTKGGARGVGVTVTRAVVISMVCIFIVDLILTFLMPW